MVQTGGPNVVLPMPSPYKHPKTGTYWVRKVVPLELRRIVKRSELKASLRTKDPRAAKERVTVELDRFNATLESARSRLSGLEQTLSARQMAAIVGAAYRRWLDKQGDHTGNRKAWQAELNELTELFQADEHGEYTFQWELWVICDADVELRAQGIVAGEATKVRVAEQWARARISFVRAMIGRCEGDWSRPAGLDRFPVVVDAPKPKLKPVIIEDLLDGWATETQKSGKALYDRQRTVAAFVHHLGHNDAARVTADDVVAYKEARLAKGVTVKTVANDLNELSPIFTWAKRNKKLAFDQNPFAGIAPLKRTTATRQRDPYTVEEAHDLLVAARAQTGFLRWFPWLLCFTGARLGEVLQACKEDILPIEGVADAWALHIHANGQGRALKTPQSERHVPLHPALVAEGLLAYVASLDDKSPLFPGIGLDKFGTRKGRGGNEHSEWVREVVGIKDKRKDPAHAWRHLFETRGRQARVPKDVRDALTGHKLAGNASDDYGESYQFMPEATFEYVGRMSNPVLMNAGSPALIGRRSGRSSGFQPSPVALSQENDSQIVHLHTVG